MVAAGLSAQPSLPFLMGVLLVDLEEHQCSWPLHGEGRGTRFCAAETTGRRRSYCQHHETFVRGEGTPSERSAVRDAIRIADL